MGLLLVEFAVRVMGLAPAVGAIWIDDADSFYRRSTNAVLNYEIKPAFSRMTHSGKATSNEHGFRDQARTLGKPEGVRRILMLGDSVVEGINYVDDENTLSRHLQRLYPDGNTEVLNLGTSGYCTLAEITLLRERGLAFQPDVVLLVFVENDFNNFNPEHTVAGGTHDRPAWAKQMFVSSHLFRHLCLRGNWFHFADEADPSTWNRRAIGQNNVVDGLALLRELANQQGFEVQVVAWPVFEDALIGHPSAGDRPLIIERLAAMNGLPVKRLDREFNQAWQSLSPRPNPREHFTVRGDGMHPNGAAAALTAKILRQWLDEPIAQPPYQTGERDTEAIRLAAMRAGEMPINTRSIEGRRFESLMYRDRVDEAHEYLLGVLSEDPANPWANYCLGWSFFSGPQPTSSLPFLQNAVQLLPDEVGARTRLAFVLNALDKPEKARRVLETGLQRSENTAEIHIALGAIAITNGDHKLAERRLNTAAKLTPNNHNVSFYLNQIGAATNRVR